LSEHVWLVDYDISTVDQARRRAFYRELAKLKARLGLCGKMSSASVVWTSDRGLAEEVFKVASQYARTANLYEARLEASKEDCRTCDRNSLVSTLRKRKKCYSLSV